MINKILIVLNGICFILMFLDKFFSKTYRRRIPEKTLLFTAALGGSLGAFLGMLLFRHKTRHRKFTIGIPLFALIHIVIFIYFVK